MTVDAVGGVWRYAMDLAAGLAAHGHETVFAGLGPPPSAAQRAEAERLGVLRWLSEPLDWTVADPSGLATLPRTLSRLAAAERADLLHLNAPSQAAGLETGLPVVVASHSCVVTWFGAVRGSAVPRDWTWHERLNRDGFARADAALAPSLSHARLIEAAYGPVPGLAVALNAAHPQPAPDAAAREPFVLAAGRWWDEGKNHRTLDAAAAQSAWPVRAVGALSGPAGQAASFAHADALGEAPAAAVRLMMRRAGAFVSPSVYEPFGLAVLEAALCETPLVLADIPTFRELWDGAALFAEPRDPASFAKAFDHLAARPKLRRDLGQRAALRARAFSPARQVTAVLGAYRAAQAAAAARRETAA